MSRFAAMYIKSPIQFAGSSHSRQQLKSLDRIAVSQHTRHEVYHIRIKLPITFCTTLQRRRFLGRHHFHLLNPPNRIGSNRIIVTRFRLGIYTYISQYRKQHQYVSYHIQFTLPIKKKAEEENYSLPRSSSIYSHLSIPHAYSMNPSKLLTNASKLSANDLNGPEAVSK